MERKIDRFDQYMKLRHLTDSQVTNYLGLSNGLLGKSRKEGRDLSEKAIQLITEFYYDINSDWLIFGEGRMIQGPYERINHILETEGLSQKEFAKGAGNIPFLLPFVYKQAQKNPGDPKVLKQWVSALVKRFPQYSEEWIMTGKGEVLKTDQAAVKEYSTDGVPYYAVDFLAGFDLVINDQTAVPDGFISFPHIRGAEAWVDISGKSMSPLIDPGDVIAIKHIDDWQTNILYGEVYALVTDQYRTVKRIRKSDRDGWIRLVPENPDYDAQDIPVSSVRSIYQVLGCAKKIF